MEPEARPRNRVAEAEGEMTDTPEQAEARRNARQETENRLMRELYLRYDGPIPKHQIENARQRAIEAGSEAATKVYQEAKARSAGSCEGHPLPQPGEGDA